MYIYIHSLTFIVSLYFHNLLYIKLHTIREQEKRWNVCAYVKVLNLATFCVHMCNYVWLDSNSSSCHKTWEISVRNWQVAITVICSFDRSLSPFNQSLCSPRKHTFLAKLSKSEDNHITTRVFQTLLIDNVYNINSVDQCNSLQKWPGCWFSSVPVSGRANHS